MIQPVVAEDQHRQHDAHVHAQLNLVASGKTLQVELETPSNNLLGFEHQARSEKDKKSLQQAMAVLNDPSKWLRPDAAASCKLQDIDIESALLEEDHDHEHGHDDHDDHGHDKHAKHDDHDDHDHDKHAKHDDHDHHDHAGEVHSEFDITLSFACARPDRLQSVDASGLFQRFPNMEEIDVQWITDSKQSATELSRGRGIISLQ